jgi:hypothetical protein
VHGELSMRRCTKTQHGIVASEEVEEISKWHRRILAPDLNPDPRALSVPKGRATKNSRDRRVQLVRRPRARCVAPARELERLIESTGRIRSSAVPRPRRWVPTKCRASAESARTGCDGHTPIQSPHIQASPCCLRVGWPCPFLMPWPERVMAENETLDYPERILRTGLLGLSATRSSLCGGQVVRAGRCPKTLSVSQEQFWTDPA